MNIFSTFQITFVVHIHDAMELGRSKKIFLSPEEVLWASASATTNKHAIFFSLNTLLHLPADILTPRKLKFKIFCFLRPFLLPPTTAL